MVPRSPSVGKASELIVAAEMLKAGFEVYFPVEDRGLDLVVRRRHPTDTGFIGIQVKSVEKTSHVRNVHLPRSKRDWRLVVHLRPQGRYAVLHAGEFHLTKTNCMRNAGDVIRRSRLFRLSSLPEVIP